MTEHHVTQADRLAASYLDQTHGPFRDGFMPMIRRRFAAHRIATEATQKQKADALAEAVEKAMLQFTFYAESHAAKGTLEGDRKAEVILALAIEMKAALAAYEGEA